MKPYLLIGLIIAVCMSNFVDAARKDRESGSSRAIKKLQLMVNEITTERDRLKTEHAKSIADLETLKKQLETEQKKTKVESEKHANELATREKITGEVRSHLDAAMAKLREVIDKYNVLNEANHRLQLEHNELKNKQQFISTELNICQSKNVKMAVVAKDVINQYQRCQEKGIVETVLDTEPLFQINNIKFEKMMQDYEDKLSKEHYHPNRPSETQPEAKMSQAK
jgi:chromosome segregation ATPase